MMCIGMTFELIGCVHFVIIFQNQEVDIYADLEPFRSPSIHEDDIYGLIRSCGIIDIPRAAVRSMKYAVSIRSL